MYRFRVIGLILCSAALLGCRPSGTVQERASSSPRASSADRASGGARPVSEAALDYVELVTAGADAGAVLPTVVAVHGLGDRPEQFKGLIEGLPFKARVILPRGPMPWHGGYSWFDIALPYVGTDEGLAAGVATAADRVAALIDTLAKERPTRGRPILTGFSQGGMIAFAVAVRHPDAIDLSVPVSGALPEALMPVDGARIAPIRALHGDADPIVPISGVLETVARLERLGADVSLSRYPGVGHTITSRMRAELFRRLRAAASQPAASAPAPRSGK